LPGKFAWTTNTTFNQNKNNVGKQTDVTSPLCDSDYVLFGCHHMDWLVEANILKKCAVSIFKAEVMSQDSEGPYIQEGRGEV
jgi:hypothetical protein